MRTWALNPREVEAEKRPGQNCILNRIPATEWRVDSCHERGQKSLLERLWLKCRGMVRARQTRLVGGGGDRPSGQILALF